jgi:aspartyl-tRNA(Asn)/glutamyl-tRNA(Gln) amidotransferase subunit A
MTDDLAWQPAIALLKGYREGRYSPVDATRAVLDRVVAHNERLNAFCLVDGSGALRAAEESATRWAEGAPIGPLDGVPVSIKDIVLMRGTPTLRGSKTIDPDQAWDEDAPAVARLRAAGAVLLGKTTTPEFGWKGVTDSPLTGITRNPWDLARTPGGSSGGAAAALATGMGPLALGSDGGGSIRIPSAFTGVYGIKATYGRVPAWPHSPFGNISHVGPMARTVSDAALMLTVMAQPDPRDCDALPYDGADFRDDIETGVAGLRIAFSPTLCGQLVDPGVEERVAEAARVFADLGANVEEAEPPISDLREVFRVIWYAGAARLLRMIPAERHGDIDPGLREIAAAGERVRLPQFQDAIAARSVLGSITNQFHTTFDLLLTPTMPIPALDAGLEVPPGSGLERWFDWSPFTYPFNLTGQPAASVPCGLTTSGAADGMPVGLQIVAARYREDLVLRASRAFERVMPWPHPEI